MRGNVAVRVALFAVAVIAGLLVASSLVSRNEAAPKALEAPAPSQSTPTYAPRLAYLPLPDTGVEPRLAERAPGEWQGMLADGDPWPCESTAACGLARVCIDGYCVGCRAHVECVPGEVCVLEHCLKRELARCRSARDCARRELCVMSGYSSGPRANDELRSACLTAGGPGANPFFVAPQEQAPSAPTTAPAVAPNQELLDELKRKIGARAATRP